MIFRREYRCNAVVAGQSPFFQAWPHAEENPECQPHRSRLRTASTSFPDGGVAFSSRVFFLVAMGNFLSVLRKTRSQDPCQIGKVRTVPPKNGLGRGIYQRS